MAHPLFQIVRPSPPAEESGPGNLAPGFGTLGWAYSMNQSLTKEYLIYSLGKQIRNNEAVPFAMPFRILFIEMHVSSHVIMSNMPE